MKDRWKPLTTIGTGKKVIPMMLRAQHYYTLQLKEGEKTFPEEWKKKALETTWTGRARGKLSRIENTPDSTLRPMSAAQSLPSMRAPASTVRETSLTNRTPRTVKTPRSARKAASELNSELRSPASTAKKNSRARSAEQSRKGDNQAQTPNSMMRASDSTEGRTRSEYKESRQSELRTPRTQNSKAVSQEDRAHTSGSSSTIRIPCSAAHESRRAKKNSKQPEIQRPRRQTTIEGAADSSAAETRGEKAIPELDGMLEFQEQASQQLRCPTRPPRSAFQNERKKIVIQRGLAQYRNMQWQCPVCTEQLTPTMPWTKRTHLLERHPLEVAKRREEEGLKPGQQLSWLRMSEETPKNRTPVLATDELPKAERGWTCWVCEKGLPFMHPAQRVLSIRTHLKQHEGVLSSQGKSAHAKRNVKAQDQARAANVSRMHQVRRERGAKNGHDILKKVEMGMQEMSAACGAMRSEDRSGPMD